MAYPVGLVDRGQAPSIWPKDTPMKILTKWATTVTNEKKRERYIGIVKSSDLYVWTRRLRNDSQVPCPPGPPPTTPKSTGQANRIFDRESAIWRLRMREWMQWWADQGWVTDKAAIFAITAPLTLDAENK